MICLPQFNQKRPELARMNAEEEEEPGIKPKVERCVSFTEALCSAALCLPRCEKFLRCCSDALWWQLFLQPTANRLPFCETKNFVLARIVA